MIPGGQPWRAAYWITDPHAPHGEDSALTVGATCSTMSPLVTREPYAYRRGESPEWARRALAKVGVRAVC